MQILSSPLNLLNRARRAGRAALVRAAAGQPMAAPDPRSRRGTVLVLILGALALISVITLIYTTVGQSDRRAGESTKVKADVAGTVERVTSHIGGVVADGSVSIMVDGITISGDGDQVPVWFRKSWDYGFTDPFRRSVVGNSAVNADEDDRHFDPTGSYDRPFIVGGGADLRFPCTPFLAATAPTDLANDGAFTDRRDWLHITNISPDGRFVNLWNIRGNFDARSGYAVSGNNPAPIGPRAGALKGTLSFGLVLRDSNGDPTENLPTGAVRALDVNTPAQWSDFQYRAAGPAAGPMYYQTNTPDPTTGRSPNSPGSIWYAPYQWCDTDGDGFFDARWFELVDAANPTSPVSLLPADGRFRWFVAARVMDLNALVNVNTAADFQAPPRAVNMPGGGQYPQANRPVTPLGLTPADIDLRRLLTRDDVSFQWTFVYDQLLQGLGADDYSGYDGLAAVDVGGGGYDVLRLVLRRNGASVPPAGPYGATIAYSADDRSDYYLRFGSRLDSNYIYAGGVRSFEFNARFGMDDLLELLTYHGVNDPHATSRLEQALDSRGSSAANALLGVVRSNRSGGFESPVDIGENNGLGNGVADAEAMRLLVADVRRLLTTMNGDRPLRVNRIPNYPDNVAIPPAKNVLDPDVDLKVNARQAIQDAITPRREPATGAITKIHDVRELYAAYCDALLPHSGRFGAWSNASLRTLAYGYNPSLALRIAAHMTANAVDAYDRPRSSMSIQKQRAVAGPTPYTVLIDERFRAPLEALPPTANNPFQWWLEPAPGLPGVPPTLNQPYARPHGLDLDPEHINDGPRFPRDRLPDSSQGDPAPLAPAGALNVYGVEAQPFITQVVTMAVYHDAPPSAGGDDEFDPGVPPGGVQPPITIDGNFPAPGDQNPDFLGQFIAFQLTNPFSEPVQLTEYNIDPFLPSQSFSSTEITQYYLEFAGRYYKLAQDDPSTLSLTTVTLRPGETRIFVATSHPVEGATGSLQERWNRAAGGTTQPIDAVQRFLDTQFAISPTPGITYGTTELTAEGLVRPIMIKRMEVNQTTGEPTGADATDTVDLFEPAVPGSLDLARRKVVHLWRVLRSQVDATGVNIASNDMLADRLREPPGSPGGRAVLDPRLPQGTTPGIHNIDGTQAGDPGTSEVRDNTGIGVAFWGSLKRRDDPRPAAGRPPLGAIPAYCVEAKWGSTMSNSLKNIQTRSKGKLDDPDCRLLYDNVQVPICGGALYPQQSSWFWPNTATDFPAFISKLVGPNGSGNMPFLVDGLNDRPETWNFTTPTIHAMPSNRDTPARLYRDLYPQIHLNNDEYGETLPVSTSLPSASGTPTTISTLRVTDLLTPLGLGPEHIPGMTATAVGAPLDQQHEPDQYKPGYLTLAEALAIGLNYSYPPAPPATGTPTTDMGFALYHRAGDRLIGALDRGNLVLDRFAPFVDVNPPAPYTTAPVFDGADVRRMPGIPLAANIFNIFTAQDTQLGGLTRSTPGRININTAPPEVLRLLPMLSPTTETDSSGQVQWDAWRQQAGLPASGGPTIPSPIAVGTTPPSDMGATVAALRDRRPISNRYGTLINFGDTGGADPFDPSTWDGRFLTNRIPGIAEFPGLPGVGGILGAVERNLSGSGDPTVARVGAGDQIDFLGQERVMPGLTAAANSSIASLASTLYPDPTQPGIQTAKDRADVIEDDWFEKLELAAGVADTTTVRSDVFAVWFVLHGYQRSDTLNLKPEDPLVPSVAKRYVMVLDRSNVTHKGEKPRIVLFTELPLSGR